MGFTSVATVIAAVTISAVWSVLHDSSMAAVSLRDIAESDVIPLDVHFVNPVPVCFGCDKG
jgi:hypothetical protein